MMKNNILVMIVTILVGIAFLAALGSVAQDKLSRTTDSIVEYEVNFTEGENNLSVLALYPNAYCQDIVIIDRVEEEEILGPGNYTFYTNCTYIVRDTSPYINTDVDISYDYGSGDGSYIENQTTRTLIHIIIALFALTLLGFVVAGLMKQFGESN